MLLIPFCHLRRALSINYCRPGGAMLLDARTKRVLPTHVVVLLGTVCVFRFAAYSYSSPRVPRRSHQRAVLSSRRPANGASSIVCFFFCCVDRHHIVWWSHVAGCCRLREHRRRTRKKPFCRCCCGWLNWRRSRAGPRGLESAPRPEDSPRVRRRHFISVVLLCTVVIFGLLSLIRASSRRVIHFILLKRLITPQVMFVNRLLPRKQTRCC